MKIGSLFSGYGGLDLAAAEVYEAELTWYADVCRFGKDGAVGHHEPHRAPCSIMAHHHPDVPNLGDVSAIDWSSVEPVDILTGGSPCQDLSTAGKRAGMTDGTRSNLWVAMREAIAVVRPLIVIWENVRGAFTAAADSDLEHCPGCVGDGSDEPALRALGRVLGDLSDLGYDASWHGLRAAEVGAPHGRFRVFVAATDARREPGEVPTARRFAAVAQPAGNGDPGRTGLTLLKTPTSQLAVNGGSQHPDKRRAGGHGPTLADEVEHLLPAPAAHEPGGTLAVSMAVQLLPTPTDVTKGGGESRSGARSGEPLLNGIERLLPDLLPTPMAGDAKAARNSTATRHKIPPTGVHAGDTLSDITYAERWGDYTEAISRWEHVIGRPAPKPTTTGAKGNPQLSPRFVEWMMGLPAGWVIDVPGITRNEALKALGNGVVPQQAIAALRLMASWPEVAAS